MFIKSNSHRRRGGDAKGVRQFYDNGTRYKTQWETFSRESQ
jgi:hypothetical protein